MLCSRGSVPGNAARSDRQIFGVLFCRSITTSFSHEQSYMVDGPRVRYCTIQYCVYSTCERGVVVPRGVKVGREEINTRYGVMPMIHWWNDKGHFYV